MTSDETTRAEEEAVASVRNNETGNPSGDHEVANTSTTGDTKPKIAADKTGKKKDKRAKKAASSLVDGTATAAKSQGSAHDKWYVCLASPWPISRPHFGFHRTYSQASGLETAV
ncbi:hypothetical protein L209DRAFT_750529 [Thermothelomyces heterothallicus CBS 203.75]